MKKKRIGIEKYNKLMDKIIAKKLPIHETFFELINEASKYKIIIKKKRKGKNEKRTK